MPGKTLVQSVKGFVTWREMGPAGARRINQALSPGSGKLAGPVVDESILETAASQ